MALLACGQVPSDAAGQAADHPSNGVVEMSLKPVFPVDSAAQRRRDPSLPPVYGSWAGVVEVTIKNTSPLKIRCITSHAFWFDHDVQVLDPDGNPVPLTPLGQSALPVKPGPHPDSGAVEDLEPSQQSTETLLLQAIFQIVPGKTYTVRVRRSRGLPPVDAMGRPLPELSATVVIKGGPGGADR